MMEWGRLLEEMTLAKLIKRWYIFTQHHCKSQHMWVISQAMNSLSLLNKFLEIYSKLEKKMAGKEIIWEKKKEKGLVERSVFWSIYVTTVYSQAGCNWADLWLQAFKLWPSHFILLLFLFSFVFIFKLIVFRTLFTIFFFFFKLVQWHLRKTWLLFLIE